MLYPCRFPLNDRKGSDMKGKMKALDLAVVAAIATSAIGVGSASAEYSGHFVIEGTHATVVGSETATHRTRFTLSGLEGFIECEKASYSGFIGATTVGGFTVTPKYEGCKTAGTAVGVTITPNGCTYTFKSTEKVHATFLFLCGEKSIEIHHPNCTVTIPQQQQPASGVSYTTVLESGKHALTANLTISNVEAEYHGGACVFLGTNQKAALAGSLTLRATNTAGSAVHLTNT
jgi:hypothetical protein